MNLFRKMKVINIEKPTKDFDNNFKKACSYAKDDDWGNFIACRERLNLRVEYNEESEDGFGDETVKYSGISMNNQIVYQYIPKYYSLEELAILEGEMEAYQNELNQLNNFDFNEYDIK